MKNGQTASRENLTCTYWAGRCSCLDNAVSRVKGNLGAKKFGPKLSLFLDSPGTLVAKASCQPSIFTIPEFWKQSISRMKKKKMEKNQSLLVSFLSKSILSIRQPKKRIIGPREIPAWGLNYKLAETDEQSASGLREDAHRCLSLQCLPKASEWGNTASSSYHDNLLTI